MPNRLLRLSFCSVIFSLCVCFASTSAQAGETINYDGTDPTLLANEPIWDDAGSLFPASSLNGNTVTVTGGTIAGEVYGGVTSGSSDVANNKVIITGGTVDYYVLGGYSKNGNVTGNSVSITGGTLNDIVMGGYGNGNVYNNSVSITNGTTSHVYGGNSRNANAYNNSVNITGGTTANIYGGKSTDGNAYNNSVAIADGTINGYISGGESSKGNAYSNSVIITGGTLKENVYGGFGFSSGSAAAQVYNNSITITGGLMEKWVVGGYSKLGGLVSGNKVVMSGGIVNESVTGGEAINGNAENNSVFVSGTALIKKDVTGGGTDLGNATGNSVNISGGTITGYINGGWSGVGNTTGNSVTITSGLIEKFVTGGYSRNGLAGGNKVVMTGGTVNTNIIGGESTTGSANNNSLLISDAALIKGWAIGGYSDSGEVSGNTVVISGGTVDIGVRGGESVTGNVYSNSVSITGGTIGLNVHGGFVNSGTGNAYNNSVSITGGMVTGSVYGGFVNSGTGNAYSNSVSITGGRVTNFVYGGRSDTGNAYSNSVSITGGSVDSPYAYVYGGFVNSGTGNAYSNSVSITGGTIGSASAPVPVYGGYIDSGTGNAYNNSVSITGGTVGGDVYGGQSDTGNAYNNSVVISGSGSGQHVYGGRSNSGNAYNNSVVISGSGSVGGDVFGGSSSSSGSGNAYNNSVVISGSGSVGGSVRGGYSYSGDATYNTVSIGKGASLANSSSLHGGYAGMGSGDVFTGNTLNLLGWQGKVKNVGNFEFYNFVLPANFASGSTQLTVTNDADLSDGAGKSSIVNVEMASPQQVGKAFTLIDATAGTLTGTINEEKSSGTSSATGIYTYNLFTANKKLDLFVNKLKIDELTDNTANYNLEAGAGTAKEWVGLEVNNNLNANTFVISSSAVAEASLKVGGTMAVNSFTATQGSSPLNINVETLGVSSQNTTLTLNNTSAWNGSTGVNFNTIVLEGAKTLALKGNGAFNFNNLQVKGKGNVWDGNLNAANKTISFYFTPDIVNNDTMLTVTKTADLTNSKIDVNIMGGMTAKKKGDSFTFIEAGTLTTVANSLSKKLQWHKGISLIYDVDLAVAGNKLIATINDVQASPESKALVEGRAGGAAFVNQGADMAAGQGLGAAVAAAGTNMGLAGFGAISGGTSRYKTGSHVDVDGFSLITGLSWATPLFSNNLILGAFFEAGWGSYNSYNSFSNANSVKGEGDTEYYGGGILARYELSEGMFKGLYSEASARAGFATTDFSSADLQDATGQQANYDSGAAYYGAHAGLGYIWRLNDEASLDFSTKYLWTHQNSDSVKVLGDPIEFKASDSQRWRNGLRFSYDFNAEKLLLTPYLGVAYEYEFDSKTKATAYGHDIEAPSLKGGTSVGEVGITLKPLTDYGLKNGFSLDLGLQGYTGMREGVTGSLQMKYEF